MTEETIHIPGGVPRAESARDLLANVLDMDVDVEWYIDYALVRDPIYDAKRVIYRRYHCAHCEGVVWAILSDPSENLYQSWAGAWTDIKEGRIHWTTSTLRPHQLPVPVSG